MMEKQSATQQISTGTVNQFSLLTLVRGLAMSQMIGAVCDIGLPNVLEPGESTSIAGVAIKLGVNEEVLRRLCRTLAAFGLFLVDANDRIQHNPISLMLREGQEGAQYWAARFWTTPVVWAAWGELRGMLESGTDSFREKNGERFFRYMRDHEKEAQIYNSYMAGGYDGRHRAIASVLDMRDVSTVIDVGGGTGSLLRVILRRHSGLRGILFDQASVISGLGLSNEIFGDSNFEVIEGDFFDSVPRGGDLYILSWILHDWPDQEAMQILQACYAAMRSGKRLVIIDRLLESDPAKCNPFDLLLDIQMMVLHQAKERTTSEFNDLLTGSGFTPINPVLIQPGFSILETRRV